MNHHPTIRSYTDASAFLGNRAKRNVEYATVLHRIDGDSIAVRYHSTDIVTYYQSGQTVLTSGSWHSPTTKDRLNRYGSLRMWQSHGTWYLDSARIFSDDMRILPDGSLTGFTPVSPDTAKESRKLRADIKRYCSAYLSALFSGDVPAPSSGDCWYCVMRTDTGVSLGEATQNVDHILSHLAERYYVPSLLTNAIKRYPVSPIAHDYLCACFNPSQPHAESYRVPYVRSIGERDLGRSLYRYLMNALGLIPGYTAKIAAAKAEASA